MTWDAYNRRKAALREIFTIVDRRRDLTPTDLIDRVDPQREAFDDEGWMLLEIQSAWFQRLSGMLDRLTSEIEASPTTVAVDAWVATAAEMPGARSLLDAHLDEPMLAKGLASERAMMAAVAGAHGKGDALITEARAKTIYPIRTAVEAVDVDGGGSGPTGFVARLKSVLAA